MGREERVGGVAELLRTQLAMALPMLKTLFSAALSAYALLLVLARELIDAQLKILGEVGGAAEVRREKVEVE
ncbi:MAG: hypothetical protein N3H31_07420 [Candidatus Nezhaarchaeota archaeon]|nr:hypothetical protein [Candidatus Nezhaarchaeota archaeon]